jgi:uncharacterized protein (DUF2236 family)
MEQSGMDPETNPIGYFEENCMIRHVAREGLVLLGAGRAVLLQLAHPLVAEGVNRNSSFMRDPLARFIRTMEFMHTLVFADRQSVEAAIKSFDQMHARVKGELSEQIGAYEQGTRYSGQDPTLKLWVFATLVDSSNRAYQRFVRRMHPEQQREYYRDARRLGTLMGIPDQMLPDHLEGFEAYLQNMLTGDDLTVSPASHRIAQHVLHPEVSIIPGISAGLMRLATAGMLPPRWREAFNLNWDRKHALALRALSIWCRTVRPIAPPRVWQGPMQRHGSLARFLLRDLKA